MLTGPFYICVPLSQLLKRYPTIFLKYLKTFKNVKIKQLWEKSVSVLKLASTLYKREWSSGFHRCSLSSRH